MPLKHLRGLAVAALLLAAGCQEVDYKNLALRAEMPLPDKLIRSMQDKGMTKSSPVLFRIFKEENKFEVWKRKNNGRYDLLTTYEICKISGELGPKFREGDRQAPEGFYNIRIHQMNPKSSYFLSFDTGFPNAFDRVHGRTGANLMVHGACSSSGCYSMTDEQVAEIYAFARDAFRGGQTEIQLQAFPFRLTAANMARYRNDPNYAFWQNLKEGYDRFEIARTPPKVNVCEKRYVFDMAGASDPSVKANGPCPAPVMTSAIESAYASHKAKEQSAIEAALSKGTLPPPAPSIAGPKEAAMVTAWSKARASGKKVSRLPPSFEQAESQKAAEAAAKAELAVPETAPAPAAKPQETAAVAPRPEAPDDSARTDAKTETPAADAAKPAEESGAAPADATAASAKKPWWKVWGS